MANRIAMLQWMYLKTISMIILLKISIINILIFRIATYISSNSLIEYNSISAIYISQQYLHT